MDHSSAVPRVVKNHILADTISAVLRRSRQTCGSSRGIVAEWRHRWKKSNSRYYDFFQPKSTHKVFVYIHH